MTAPNSLAPGGRALWDAITDAHDELDATQLVQLEEACRAKDRLDRLDLLLTGDLDAWLSIQDFIDGRPPVLVINSALTQANATANLMKQLLAALRLPDPQSGKKPQFRGPRGAQKPTVPGGKVSSLDRARAAKSS
jgi:hypothetical protein